MRNIKNSSIPTVYISSKKFNYLNLHGAEISASDAAKAAARRIIAKAKEARKLAIQTDPLP